MENLYKTKTASANPFHIQFGQSSLFHVHSTPIFTKTLPVLFPCSNPPLHRGEDGNQEVIQPHLPVRLPCYDFCPLIELTFAYASPKGNAASGKPNSGATTGGVYKEQGRIHRVVDDTRLLGNPRS